MTKLLFECGQRIIAKVITCPIDCSLKEIRLFVHMNNLKPIELD